MGFKELVYKNLAWIYIPQDAAWLCAPVNTVIKPPIVDYISQELLNDLNQCHVHNKCSTRCRIF
jgi:hypothetical protein